MTTHETMILNAGDVADTVLAPGARQNDRDARFSTEAIAALGQAGLLGLTLPEEVGGAGLGLRTFAEVMATLAEADASVAMVYLMHTLAASTIAAAPPSGPLAAILREIAAGRHLSTLAFSEAGSRSHFWAPVSRARRDDTGVHLSAKKSWVTSAGHAQSYVVSALSPDGSGPTDTTLYLVPSDIAGLSVAGPWDGLGLRANASAPMVLDDCKLTPDLRLTEDGSGFGAMMSVVLPQFQPRLLLRGAGPLPGGDQASDHASANRTFRASGTEPRRGAANAAGASRHDGDRHGRAVGSRQRSRRPSGAAARHDDCSGCS